MCIKGYIENIALKALFGISEMKKVKGNNSIDPSCEPEMNNAHPVFW